MSLIHPRQIIEKAQSGEPYDGELEPLLRGLSVADPSSLANLTIDYAHRRPSPFFTSPINTEDLKQFALAFHKKAGTDTSEVIRNIDNISCNTPRIRVAHQANLFPSLGVVSQVFLMNALNQRLKEQSNAAPSQLFVIV